MNWILDISGIYFYLLLSLALLGGAIGLPIPEDLGLVFAGIGAERRLGNTFIIFIVAYTSIVLGDLFIYSIGYRYGISLFKKRWFRNKVHPQKIREIKARLEKNSFWMIFVARHLFYFRTVTFLTCGAVKMRFLTFLLADSISALVSTPILMAIGYYASEHYEKILSIFKNSQNIIALIALVALLIFLRKKSNAALQSENSKSLSKSSQVPDGDLEL